MHCVHCAVYTLCTRRSSTHTVCVPIPVPCDFSGSDLLLSPQRLVKHSDFSSPHFDSKPLLRPCPVSFCGQAPHIREVSADGCAPAHTAPSSLPSSCGILGGLPSEQAADRRQGTAALQGVPAERAAALRRASQLGCPELCPHRPLAAGLVSHGCQPGRPGSPWSGHLLIHPGLWLRQYGPHGCTLGPLHVPGQRGTDLVRGRMGHLGGRHSDSGPQGRYAEPSKASWQQERVSKLSSYMSSEKTTHFPRL